MHPLDAVGFDVEVIGCLFCSMRDTYATVAIQYGVIVQRVGCYVSSR
jgi:hypothetical protein